MSSHSTTDAILVLWDQLSLKLSALPPPKATTPIIIVEAWDDCHEVPHHKKKLVFLLAAMRQFRDTLVKRGYTVHYHALTAQANSHLTLTQALVKYQQQLTFTTLRITQPGAYRQLALIQAFTKAQRVQLEVVPDTRFVSELAEFSAWVGKYKDPKQALMETFYRQMRRKTGLLMEADKPVGGKWNFDADNRKPLPAGHDIPLIKGFKPTPVVQSCMQLVEQIFPEHFGSTEPFWFATTPRQAEIAVTRFIEGALANFGDYQDAMQQGEAFLYHSVLSQYLNVGLLSPLAVCEKVETAYHAGKVGLAAAEGFIRQVIGWREYIRGIYWHNMPSYATVNALQYTQPLPHWYWDGDTKLNCLRQTIQQTRRHAYSHHIQRLMVTGNFAALIGIAPKAIHAWYLAVYADAFEWVEMPNTLGMATFADGGIVGTKPYVSSGNYINKMSDYCKNCWYDVKQKTGARACPFNYLYWHFLYVHQASLRHNPRLRMPYHSLNKMPPARLQQITKDSQQFIAQLRNPVSEPDE